MCRLSTVTTVLLGCCYVSTEHCNPRVRGMEVTPGWGLEGPGLESRLVQEIALFYRTFRLAVRSHTAFYSMHSGA
jgi:hypothetical protein